MLYLIFDRMRETLSDWGVAESLRFLDRIEFRALAAALLSFLFVMLAGRPVIGWLRRKKIGDAGVTDAESLRAHSKSKANTPTMGGVLIVGAILFSMLMLADVRNFYVFVGIIVVVWLAVLGGFDDWLKLTSASRPGGSRQGLYAWEKFVFQIGLGLIVGWFLFSQGGDPGADADQANMAHVLNIPFQSPYTTSPAFGISDSLWFLPAILFVPIAMLLIAGMSNAVNLTDGMDGLATGITAIVSLGLVVLTAIAGDESRAHRMFVPYIPFCDELIILPAAMAGACFGFLWFNCYPAQVFMGDTGSLPLGGAIAYTAIVIRQEVLLLIMSGIFLFEIMSVVLQVGYFRMSKGKRLFRCAPAHHHFHLGGWTEQQVVVRFWIISAILVVAALTTIRII